MLLGQKRPERQSRGDRLGDGDNVGHHAEILVGKDFAGASEATLDLVEDERGMMMIGQATAGQQEFFRTFENSAFSKDGLEHNGAGVGIDGRVEGGDIVLADEGYVFEHRLETFAVFFLAGEGHGSKGAAVIRTLEGYELRFGLTSGPVSGETREFDCAFHGFGAAVRKEGAIQTGKLAQALGELPLIFVVIEIRKVNGAGRLLADGLHDARMSMA
jgi:hypothetical protein